MPYTIEQQTERNVDTPLTNFPVGEDSRNRKMDITSDLILLVNQYNQYFQSGNKAACDNIIKNNPQLKLCMFQAEDDNWKRDAIIAMQRYLLNQVPELYNQIAKNAIGIQDSPTAEQADLVAYSAKKIDKLHQKRNITLLAAGWSDTYPFTQTVSVAGVSASDDLKVIGVVHASGNSVQQDKLIDKNAGYLMTTEQSVQDDAVLFRAKKKPTIDFTVVTEGG